MKNLLFLSGMILALLLGACATSPAEYNTAIMDQVTNVEKDAVGIAKLVQEQKTDEIQPALESSREHAKKALKKLQAMSSFRGDDSLRLAAVEFAAFYDRLFTNEYQETVNLLQRGAPFSMDESDRLFEIFTNVSKEGSDVKEKLIAEHLAFIQRYGLIIQNEP
ncbi:MAG: hypothetical protein LBR52_01760 [Prevotellaceae bacterium]|nr:hypothetical protein [Prevotellaceae bacterium]